MSIINDALKKAGQGQTLQTGETTSQPAQSLGRSAHAPLLEAAGKKKKKINWGPVFVILVLTLITGPLVAPIFSSPYRSTSAPFIGQSYQETLSTQNRQAQFAIEEAAIMPQQSGALMRPDYIGTPVVAERQNFVMNGIMYSSPDSYGLINGKVVRVGEKIDGATLIAITPEKATLNHEGKTIDLWVNR